MSFKLPLKDMSLHEKLAAMESLWEDIARTPEAVESPAWHKNIVDWEAAKADIRKKLL